VPALAWLLLIVALATDPSTAGAQAQASAESPQVAAASGPERRKPSLLLVTLDTTRSDRVGATRNGRPVTPSIDALAKDGVVFERAHSASPVTLPSHTTILTGVYPSAHGVHDNGVFRLGPEARLVSEALRDNGWHTGAFVGSYVLDPRFGLDQGFEVYGASGTAGLGSVIYAERPAHQVVDEAIGWLETLPRNAPFFAWVHLFDPHSPFEPPKAWRRRFEDPYDGEIAFADDQVGRLVRWIRHREPEGELVVVVTSDHGESFGAHGEQSHGIFLHQETMGVPLVMAGPGVPQGVRSTTPVSIAQIAPTLLGLAGLPRDLLPAVRVLALLTPDGDVAAPAEPPALYLESLTPYHSYRWHGFRGLVWRDRKLIRGARAELYDLVGDPGEATDLARSDVERTARFESRLDALLLEHASLGWGETRDVASDERNLLQALGYVEAHVAGDPFAPGLPDPRERIGDLAIVWRTLRDLERWQQLRHRPPGSAWGAGRQNQAALDALEADAEKLQGILAANPGDPTVTGLLGGVEAARGRYSAAIPLLERTLIVLPGDTLHRFNLATAYHQVGRVDDAIREMKRAIREDPTQPGFYRWLATHYVEAGEYRRASWWLRAMSQAVEPESADAREVKRWTAMIQADMRQLDHEPADPESLPLKEPGRP
jgi:choline-sulfatase